MISLNSSAPLSLDRWTRKAGLNTIEITGLVYNPLTRQYSLDPGDIDVNYMVSCVKQD